MRPPLALAALLAATLGACRPEAKPAARAPQEAAASPPAGEAQVERTPTAAPSTAPAADTLRGIVERLGSEPHTQLGLRAGDGTVCLLSFATGALAAGIEGLEVTVWGTRAAGAPPMTPGVRCAFDATRFSVRAVGGIPAVDGILLEGETSYALQLASGSRPLLRNVPPGLRSQVGARIYWAGPLDRAPEAYGVLAPPR